MILHPSAFPKDLGYPTWKPFVVTRALENQVYVMSLSRAGPHFGGSLLCPPWLGGSSDSSPEGSSDEVVRLGDEPGALDLIVDTALLKKVRDQLSFRADAHPSLAF